MSRRIALAVRGLGTALFPVQSTRRSQYGGGSGWAVTFITVSLSVLALNIYKE